MSALPPDGLPPTGASAGGSFENRRERVLHQPPNPRDVERYPPATSLCAVVRGMLRDAADADLAPPEQAVVTDHVQQCRACAVALSRAEHEVWLLRHALADASEFGPPEFGSAAVDRSGPAPGFVGRVMSRLVLDETSMLSREMLSALRDDEGGAAEGGADQALLPASAPAVDDHGQRPRRRARSGVEGAGRVVEGRTSPERSRMQPVRSLFIALCASVLFLVSILAIETRLSEARAPQAEPRIVVVSAAEAYAEYGRRLGSGQSIGEAETMMVGGRGSAEVNWHDSSSQAQPAARLQLGSNGQLRLHDGAPMLLRGDLRVQTGRAVTVPIADGSALALGEGDYRISVNPRAEEEVWQEAPPELLVSVEVLAGQAVEILRPVWGSTLVSRGGIGVYSTNRGTSLSSGVSGSGGVSNELAMPRLSAPPTQPTESLLHGTILEGSGVPAVGVDVVVAFTRDGAGSSRAARSGHDGRFNLPTGGNGVGNFAVVYAVPPSSRGDLGLKAPAAYSLLAGDGDVRLRQSLTLQPSAQYLGTVVDESGQGRHGVRVVPCVVDEWFGSVLVWPEGQTITNNQGGFRIRRLPFDLPPHQHLVLLLLHPELQTTVAPIPVRGEVSALARLDAVRMPERRTIDVRGLLPNTTYHLLEEVPGLPARRALWQRTERSDYNGRIFGLRVGGDVIWSQEAGTGLVRELRFSGQSTVPLYEPNGAALLRSTVFPQMEAIPGTDMLLSSSYRHAMLEPNLLVADGDEGGQPVQFIDSATGFTVPAVEVFTVTPLGPPGFEARLATTRFAGFAGIDANGDSCVTAVRPLPAGSSLFALAPDGSCGWVRNTEWDEGTAVVPLHAPGRVLVAARLRPSASSTAEVITLRFERAEPTLAGLLPVAVRFACAANGWEVGGVPPGDYRVLLGENAHSITVPSGGFVVLD